MKNHTLLNNLLGWLSFAIAAIVYTITIEPTTSFWDCGEFISTSYKLLVGHPPGAPVFMILGRFFSLFALDPGSVAYAINVMSALASAFTILFLFWTITHLGRRIYMNKKGETWRSWAVLGAGFVGALAYTFSDTFWFSAVEGEVYAMSSLFTAVVFWAILKWEDVADHKYANRWLVLIAYLMGLSIGVHLLNLLAIPAIVMVYYFKKFEVNRNGILLSLGVSAVLLVGILYGIIPYTVKIASWFELMFVNGFGAPFNTGIAVYFTLLIGGLIFGIWYTQKNQKVILNTILLGVTVIMIGYSSFAMIVIRSYANPTMDQNSPEDVFSMMGYLNREQYGDRPLFTGQYYNSPLDRQKSNAKKGDPVRIKKDGEYKTVDHKPYYVFDSKTTTIFPRMYSREGRHINQYKYWAGGEPKGRTVQIEDQESGEMKSITLPSFAQNLSFFFNYQVKFMYFRYFMWNFAGRQNDIQGHGEIHKGNWISGIPFIDNLRLGDQSKLPDTYKNNPARNKYYLLPLILGLLGLLFQYQSGRQGKEGFWIVMLLFFLTGLAIVLYLNQTPLQPRERDYAYAGSFYAFAIWIGLGVLAVVEGIKKFLPGSVSAVLATTLTLILVPGIMLSENWDDHNRAHRYVARDLAFNYLDTCDENAIIFTNGDNDTFPLWYAQEVEGYRTDVRVCNLSYLQTDWYIDQMGRKAYDSDPLPFSLTHDQYVTGTRDVVHLLPRIQGRVDMKEAIKFLASENPKTKEIPGYPGRIEHLPSKSFSIPADSLKVLQKGIVSQDAAGLIVPEIKIDLNKEYILKNELMILDMLSNNDWDRPIYFAVTVGQDNYASLEDYFQLEGFAYKVVPIKTKAKEGQFGRVDADKMYDKFKNKFRWGGFDDARVYLDENHQRMAMNIRNNMSRLANTLLDEGKEEQAVEILDMALTKMPVEKVPHNYFSIFLAEGYYKANQMEKGDGILKDFGKKSFQEINFFSSLPQSKQNNVGEDFQRSLAIYTEIANMSIRYYRDEVREELSKYMAKLPLGVVPDNMLSIFAAEGLYLDGKPLVGDQLLENMARISDQTIKYYMSLPMEQKSRFEYQYRQSLMFDHEIDKLLAKYKRDDLRKKLGKEEMAPDTQILNFSTN
ncbi:glycosyltransferase family 117 protein [Saccharicrinis sp. GN24d3]|uniref:glycosyltransferase family 117 protein n=1 Tax=Saccharicrinis sp. GN24d3 TaxID=3458416 RepID=UPI004035953E